MQTHNLPLQWTRADEGDVKRFRIIEQLLVSSPAILTWLFKKDRPEMREGSYKILDESNHYSSGEFVLIQVALAIWFSDGGAKTFDICRRLDAQNFQSVICAMIEYNKL